MNLKNVKNIILLSGGMDSTILAHWIKKHHEGRTLALLFNYGSKHNPYERFSAINTCHSLDFFYQKIDLTSVMSSFNSALTQKDVAVPHGHYEDKTMRKTVVPFRNGIMLSIAVGIAEDLGVKEVFIANHAGDHAVYPDCRGSFISYYNEAARAGTYNKVSVVSPFVTLKKHEILDVGLQLNVPVEGTYSCYEGGNVQCGRCSTCYERRESFYLLDKEDPTDYKDKTPFLQLKKEYESR